MKSKYLLLALIVLISGSCNLPVRSSAGFSIDLTTPSNGTIFTLPTSGSSSYLSSLRVSAKANAADGGILRINYYANGLVIGTDSSAAVGTGDSSMQWVPMTAGEYFLQSEAVRAHDSAVSRTVRVCVVEGFVILASGYTGPCTIPPRDPSAPADGPLSLSASASPSSLAYPWVTCPGEPASRISFEVRLNDISDRVALVTVTLSVTQGPLGSGSFSDVIVLNWTSSLPDGEKVFTGYDDLPNSYFQNALAGDIGSVEWTVEAIGRGDETLIEDPHSIPAAPCAAPVAGTPEPLVIEATATPASDKDCPAGTYFAPVTHQCIAIQIEPTKNGGNGGDGNQCTLSDADCAPKKFDPAKCSCY